MSVADSAISLTTSSDRTRRVAGRPTPRRAPLFSESCVECRADCSAPSTPNTTPLTIDDADCEPERRRVEMRGLEARRATAAAARRAREARPIRRTRRPAVPAIDNRKLSVKQLSKEATASRTERGANRELATPRRRAREQQMRDVRARDEQHERHRARQHEQRIAKLHALAPASMITRVESATLPSRETRRRAKIESSSRARRRIVTPGRSRPIRRCADLVVAQVERHPDIRRRLPRRSEPQRRRHHADDRVRRVVERDGSCRAPARPTPNRSRQMPSPSTATATAGSMSFAVNMRPKIGRSPANVGNVGSTMPPPSRCWFAARRLERPRSDDRPPRALRSCAIRRATRAPLAQPA